MKRKANKKVRAKFKQKQNYIMWDENGNACACEKRNQPESEKFEMQIRPPQHIAIERV